MICSLSPKRRQSLLHLLHVDVSVPADEENIDCPLCRIYHTPNAETIKVFKETDHWLELERKYEKLQTPESKRELEAYEKKIGIVHFKDMDDFRKKFGIPTKKHKVDDA